MEYLFINICKKRLFIMSTNFSSKICRSCGNPSGIKNYCRKCHSIWLSSKNDISTCASFKIPNKYYQVHQSPVCPGAPKKNKICANCRVSPTTFGQSYCNDCWGYFNRKSSVCPGAPKKNKIRENCRVSPTTCRSLDNDFSDI